MSAASPTASSPSPSSPSPSTVPPPEPRSHHPSPSPPSPTTKPIHVTERRAFVDCESHPPLPVRLAFQFLPESNVASFRLRVSVVLNTTNTETPTACRGRNSRRVAKKRKYSRNTQQTQSLQQTTLYISINPEDILSIAYDTQLSLSSIVGGDGAVSSARALPKTISAAWSASFVDQDALCLHFTLARPPQLIAPTSQTNLDRHSLKGDPAGQTDADILAAWWSLSSRLRFSVYTTADLLSESQLAVMCHAASTPCLLKSSARHNDLLSLYGGRGGTVLTRAEEKDGDAAAISEPHYSSPPSYDELALSPPPPPPHRGVKSQSLLSSSTSRLEHRESWLPSSTLSSTAPMRRNEGKQQQEHQEKVEDAGLSLGTVKAEMTALLLGQISELEARLTKKLDRHLDPPTWTGAMEERFSELQDTMTQYVDEQIDMLRQEIWESMEDRWDDNRLSTRADLDDYIDERLGDAREEIQNQLQTTGVTLLFND